MNPTDKQIRKRLEAIGLDLYQFVTHQFVTDLYLAAYADGQQRALERVQKFAWNNEGGGTLSYAVFSEWLDAQRKGSEP